MILLSFESTPALLHASALEVVTDRVMGGVSGARAQHTVLDGRACLHLRGRVEDAGGGKGFISARIDLPTALDVAGFRALAITVRGNDRLYALALRDVGLARPWQSHQAPFLAPSTWTEVVVPLDRLRPRATTRALDRTAVRSISLLANEVGADVDLAVAGLRFVA